MRLLVRILIRAYQLTISPVLAFLAGPGNGCRFQPTCSHYFLQAVETHGFWRGSWLGLCRLGRCQPWGGQGYDPVPPPRHGGETPGAPRPLRPETLTTSSHATCE
ncbi:hypothetical protein BH20VER1_BH20VER1_26750 [soil metagenome]|jgi:putative membrane protein insertion efficiency factor